MTGLGEEVYTAPDHFDDASKMVSAPGGVVEAMVEMAAKAEVRALGHRWADFSEDELDTSRMCSRAALESLGVPLSVLAELKAGTRKAVRVEKFTLPSGREGRIPNVGDVFDSAPKTPEAAR